MLIIGCDYHPSMQYIAWCEEQSGQRGERRLEHNSGEAEKFYRELKQRGIQVRVGLEASGHTRWFEQRLGHLSKQGNTLLRYLLIEAAQAAVRCDAQWRRKFVHLAMRRQRNIAIAAMARKLAVSLYWLWRNAEQASAAPQPGSHAGQLDHHSGVS